MRDTSKLDEACDLLDRVHSLLTLTDAPLGEANDILHTARYKVAELNIAVSRAAWLMKGSPKE